MKLEYEKLWNPRINSGKLLNLRKRCQRREYAHSINPHETIIIWI